MSKEYTVGRCTPCMPTYNPPISHAEEWAKIKLNLTPGSITPITSAQHKALCISPTPQDFIDKLVKAKYEPTSNYMYRDATAQQVPSKDNINHPPHYNHNWRSVECIDAIEASMTAWEFLGYLKGNVLKYVWRFRYKGGLEDLEKAQWYVGKLITKFKEYQAKGLINATT